MDGSSNYMCMHNTNTTSNNIHTPYAIYIIRYTKKKYISLLLLLCVVCVSLISHTSSHISHHTSTTGAFVAILLNEKNGRPKGHEEIESVRERDSFE